MNAADTAAPTAAVPAGAASAEAASMGAASASAASAAPTSRRLVVLGAGAALLGAAVVWKNLRRRSVAAAALSSSEARAQVQPLPSVTVVDDAQPLPEFTLAGTHGAVTRASLLGHWSVVFFGYMQCPDVCPTTLAAMSAVVRRLAPQERPQVLFVSVDPQRDTPALLASYMQTFGPGFEAATGSDDALAPLARHLGVFYQRQPKAADGSYAVDHTAAMFLVDPRARLKAVFAHPPEPDTVIANYRRLAR